MTDALMPLLVCLPFAAALIHYTPALDGEATREIERAAEAQEWIDMIDMMEMMK